MKDHRLIDERSLAFDRMIVGKLRARPELVARAECNIARWLESCSPGVRPAFLEWKKVLAGPFEELLAFLESTDERAARLRQSSPFCGILSQEERLAIIKEFAARESAAA